jgi:hypothetical protein
MKPTTAQKRAGRKAGAGKTLSGVCGLLAQVAKLPSRFEVYELPDDLVPGHSLKEALAKIRQLHSNYAELAEELELACIQRVSSGGKCRFSEELADGTDRLKCPALSLVWFTLRRVAEEKAEEAFSRWRQRTGRERRVR